ncbi:MAG: MarR family transcriptional regulator [Rhizobiaceae bacterium]|nr:MarR family transcriptional regulator [Rhizobiaceae bacterium]
MENIDTLNAIKRNLKSQPGYLLRRCVQATSKAFESACADVGITERQYDYLYVLGQVEVVTQGDLSRLLDIDRSTNTLVIGILQKKGLIQRWEHPTDTRRKCVRLTKLGQETLDITQPRAIEAAQNMLAGLSDQEAEQFLASLTKIVDRTGGIG